MTLPVVAIYCEELPRRRAGLVAHLKERAVDATLWRGVHGVSWGLQTTLEYDPGKHISPGHIGLNLAHWHVWQHLLHTLPAVGSNGVPDAAAIVFEDDVTLPVDFWKRLGDVRTELFLEFPNWQFVFLGQAQSHDPGLWNKISERVGSPDGHLCRMTYPWGTHAYMIRRSALPILMDKVGVAERNFDQQLYERALRPNHIRWCCYVPGFVQQRTCDYSGQNKPEWAPSTISGTDGAPTEIPTAVYSPDVDPATGQTKEEMLATLRVTDPYPCLYRGEPLDMVRAPNGKLVASWECGMLGVACHQKPGQEIKDVLACVPCGHRKAIATPGIRDRLPLPDGHFNPSFIRWQGRLVLATRDSWGHSKVGLWELDNPRPDWGGQWAVRPISSLGSDHPGAPRLEDPRLFVGPHPETGRPALHAAFSMPDGYPPKLVKVGFVRFADDLSRIEHTHIFDSPFGNAYEKNWIPFDHDGQIYWIYSSKPKHVIIEPSGSRRETDNNLPWAAGVVRGGAPPVAGPGGEYYHFFHGCLKQPTRNVYSVGCLTFEPRPPFRVTRQTPIPIVWPDAAAPDEIVTKRFVIFPGGCIRHSGRYHIACGIDDTYVRIVSVSEAEVEAALKNIPADDPAGTIRHSPMNLGQPLPEAF